jgi:hypothetical protein
MSIGSSLEPFEFEIMLEMDKANEGGCAAFICFIHLSLLKEITASL